MENNKSNYRFIQDNPLYYGAYLNIAKNNIIAVINHLTERFKEVECEKIAIEKEFISKKHFLKIVFNTNNDIPNERRLDILNYISKRKLLPILEYFKNKFDNQEETKRDPQKLFDEVHKFLQSIFNEIDNLRNSYTHYLIIDKETQQELERKKSIENDILKGQIENLFKTGISFAKKQHSSTLTEKDFTHLNSYKLFEDNSYTDNGFYFIVCLFLERTHAIKFLKRFKGFKNETINPFIATIKTFTYYTLKTPTVKIVNEDRKLNLLTQMLNELNKAPKELYWHLTDKDKKKFEINFDDTSRLNIINNINIETISDDQLYQILKDFKTLKRHTDRFPYFALRYIEEINAFKEIYFQISLGKIFIREYDKNIIEKNQNRRIVKEIKAFGKLSYFEENEEKIIQHLKENYGKDIYFEQYAPHYNINNNNIAFIFKENKQNFYLEKPKAFLSTTILPKLLIALMLNIKHEGMLKDFIKVNSEILDINYLNDIKNKLNLEPKTITRRILEDTKFKTKNKSQSNQNNYENNLKKRREELDKYIKKNKLKIKTNQLPQQVLDYLIGVNDDCEKVIHFAIKRLRHETKLRLKNIKKELTKPKEEQKIKLGEIATYLARDFINLTIDKNVKNKITAPYFNKLQNLLAYFSVSKSDIIKLCKELSLFNQVKGHVYLTEDLIKSSDGLIDFYIKYLEKKQGLKKGWFDELLFTRKEKNKTKTSYIIDEKAVPYSIKKITDKCKKKNIQGWIRNKKEMPIYIPNTIFDNALNGILKKKTEQSSNNYGFSQLLNEYVNGDIQPYYKYQRKYEKPIKNNKTNKAKKRKEQEITFKEVIIDAYNINAKEILNMAGRKAEKNEKKIRFHQTKDQVLKLMCEDLLKKQQLNIKPINSNTYSLIKLEKIYPLSKNNPLNIPVDISKKVYKAYTITASNTYSNQLQKGYTWTLKDFGLLGKFEYDRRVKNLLEYFEDKNNIPYELLDYELNQYEYYREKIFDEISRLEKSIYDCNKESLIKIHSQDSPYNEIQFKIYIEWLKKKNITFEDNYISHIRNKFAHSEFPEKKITGMLITKEQSETFMNNQHTKDYKKNGYCSLSKQIYNLYKQKNDKIIISLNKKCSKNIA